MGVVSRTCEVTITVPNWLFCSPCSWQVRWRGQPTRRGEGRHSSLFQCKLKGHLHELDTGGFNRVSFTGNHM